MIFTDTHCHLYLDQFESDLSDVLNRSFKNGIRNIFLPAIDWDSIKQMGKLHHPEIKFFKMAGIHPCSVEENLPVDEEKLFEYCNKPEFVAIGESGLDYYWSKEFIPEQKESLRIHCRVAKATGKPIVLHNRESTSDLLDLIEEEQDGNLAGVWHCFTGSIDEGLRALDLGLYLGAGGVITFKNAGVSQIVRNMPLDKIVLETDSPYLTPAPFRGKRNEPSYLQYTAKKMAEIFDQSMDEIAWVTTQNASTLFNVDLLTG